MNNPTNQTTDFKKGGAVREHLNKDEQELKSGVFSALGIWDIAEDSSRTPDGTLFWGNVKKSADKYAQAYATSRLEEMAERIKKEAVADKPVEQWEPETNDYEWQQYDAGQYISTIVNQILDDMREQ